MLIFEKVRNITSVATSLLECHHSEIYRGEQQRCMNVGVCWRNNRQCGLEMIILCLVTWENKSVENKVRTKVSKKTCQNVTVKGSFLRHAARMLLEMLLPNSQKSEWRNENFSKSFRNLSKKIFKKDPEFSQNRTRSVFFLLLLACLIVMRTIIKWPPNSSDSALITYVVRQLLPPLMIQILGRTETLRTLCW